MLSAYFLGPRELERPIRRYGCRLDQSRSWRCPRSRGNPARECFRRDSRWSHSGGAPLRPVWYGCRPAVLRDPSGTMLCRHCARPIWHPGALQRSRFIEPQTSSKAVCSCGIGPRARRGPGSAVFWEAGGLGIQVSRTTPRTCSHGQNCSTRSPHEIGNSSDTISATSSAPSQLRSNHLNYSVLLHVGGARAYG